MKVNVKALSVNQCWQGKRYKTKLYKAYELALMVALPKFTVPDGDLELHIQVGFSNKASDLDNIAKPFIDILQKQYDFNDSRIYSLSLHKRIVPKGKEYISFDIFECLDDKDIV